MQTVASLTFTCQSPVCETAKTLSGSNSYSGNGTVNEPISCVRWTGWNNGGEHVILTGSDDDWWGGLQNHMTQNFRDAHAIARRLGKSYIFDLAKGLPEIPEFAQILELFASKWNGNALPEKDAFRFQDLRGWHARFALIELDETLQDGSCRIMGNSFSELFGGTLQQGMRLTDARTEGVARLLHYFDQLLTMPAIGLFKGRLSYEGREHVNLRLLDLPATDRQGRPRYILSFALEI